MATEQILGSLAYVMASHPLPQALPFLQQVFDEDSDAILVTFYILFREVDPDIIKQSFRICQVKGSQPSHLFAAAVFQRPDKLSHII